MTDISRLSIATNNLDQQKKHDELVMTLNPTSNRPGSRDITSEFTVAASGLCNV